MVSAIPEPMAPPRGPARMLVIWGVAVIAALWLGLTAAGAVTQENAPGVALRLFPKNGFAYQSRAFDRATAGSTNIRDMKVTPAALADAQAALRREPLATTALTLIGLQRQARGKDKQAQQIMFAVRSLDKRQLMANAWLIAHYGQKAENVRRVLGLLNEALRIRPQLTDQYMPALAQGLTNADSIPVFQRMLKTRPAWEMTFWGAVASNDAALPNAEVLRSRMLKGSAQLGPIDATLMTAFIRAKRMDLALSYAKNLPEMPDDRDNLLRNASFGRMPMMPPLDWELVGDGRMTSAIDEGRGTLMINAIAGAGGTVARQLIALPPGDYSLLVKLGRAEFNRGTDLSVRLQCAEPVAGVAPAAFSARATADLDQPFSIPDSACRFWWVELIFSAMDAPGPASMSIAEVRVVRTRARQETEAPAIVTDGRAPE